MTASDRAAERAVVVEKLCVRPFPAVPSRTGGVVSGPLYHWAELDSTPVWDGDVADARAEEERQDGECGWLVAAVRALWGEEPDVVSPAGLLLREAAGERLPEPWRQLAHAVPELNVWQRAGRWMAIGVSGFGDDHERALVAVVTATDPP
ncbi:hypothetical protein [Streptomyces montanisoli]|uniref:Uncharacterized protein n=1 Tax=Streptomyces montanisoli TaxID=2798581 RepID=A0A940MD94_9ACTN|nr:hypothetical protein [Streptomyces montanisoli]MBP0459154.1 hypothetical protein [Streptomyces montanisoli]